MLFPVWSVEAVGAHVLARGGRVHEAAVAEVDADVRVLLAFLVEEHEVAALQARAADVARAVALLVRAARQRDAGLPVAEEDEPAAIETGRRGAAEAVGLADHLDR